MHLEIFVHSDGNQPTASVHAWWHSGRGISHAWLMERQPIEVPGDAKDPWMLLRALYSALGERYTMPASATR